MLYWKHPNYRQDVDTATEELMQEGYKGYRFWREDGLSWLGVHTHTIAAESVLDIIPLEDDHQIYMVCLSSAEAKNVQGSELQTRIQKLLGDDAPVIEAPVIEAPVTKVIPPKDDELLFDFEAEQEETEEQEGETTPPNTSPSTSAILSQLSTTGTQPDKTRKESGTRPHEMSPDAQRWLAGQRRKGEADMAISNRYDGEVWRIGGWVVPLPGAKPVFPPVSKTTTLVFKPAPIAPREEPPTGSPQTSFREYVLAKSS